MTNDKIKYAKTAAIWELVMASWLCISMNVFTNFTNYFQYYLTGIVGVGTVLAGSFITIFRIWDAFTDLGVGAAVDRTNTKLGQFRPWILAGMIICVVSSGLLVFVPHGLPENTGVRLTVYIVIYMIFVLGATMYNPATRSTAQVLTDDPKQRATVGMIRGVSLQIMYSVLPVIVYSHLLPASGGKFDFEFFVKWWKVYAVVTIFFCLIACFGLKNKDVKKKEFTPPSSKKFDFKQMASIIRNNKPLQMLILSAGSDKLATVCQNNATVVVILFAITAGNAKLNSGANTYTLVPCILMLLLGLGGVARKLGPRKAMNFGSWGGIVVCVLSILLWVFGDPRSMSYPGMESFNGWTFFTLAYLVLWCLYKGFTLVTSNVTNPMIADVIDYELYRSGNYVPGLIGSMFSFADKIISSLGPTLVSIAIAAVGFGNQLPDATTPFSNSLFVIGLFGMYGIVIIGLLVNIIAMKQYSLTPEKMAEIRRKLDGRKKG
ncbi:MAG: glucuronide permease [Hungatella sp.]|jgi:Na+/melibiose symporter-like transporter|nr:glucuronide permease [Hungatella sp.]